MVILADVRLLNKATTGGIAEYTRHMVGALLKLDQKNNYQLLWSGLRQTPPPDAWASRENAAMVGWRIPNRFLDAATRFTNNPKIDRLTRADIVYSPHFNILATDRAPRIITFHDLSFIHHPHCFNRRQRLWHWVQNYRSQAQRADCIITNSIFTAQDVTEMLRVPPERVHTVYPGLDPLFKTNTASCKNPALTLKRLGVTKPYILYLGTIEPRKNVAALIRAFNLIKENKRFKEVSLVIAGKLGWLLNDVRNAATTSPYRNSIAFLGPVASLDRAALYTGAEVFVYPSFFEGFGFPPLEAQACGCPVVTSDRTSLSEVLRRNSALFINPWKIGDIADAITVVLDDRTLRAMLIERGLTNSNRYSWKTAAKTLLNIFYGT